MKKLKITNPYGTTTTRLVVDGNGKDVCRLVKYERLWHGYSLDHRRLWEVDPSRSMRRVVESIGYCLEREGELK